MCSPGCTDQSLFLPKLASELANPKKPIPDLDPGGCAAISLACERKADLLLIDERAGREAAIARNLRTLRTTALLFDAAKGGVLSDLRGAYESLAATNFRVNRKTLEELLQRYEQFKNRG